MADTLEGHNKVLTELWQGNLNKEKARAYFLLGITPDLKTFSIHTIPNANKGRLIEVLRDAADALERGKMIILQ